MRTSTILFSTANLVGLLLILLSVASICHLARMEQRDYYDASDSFTFLATAVPISLVCLLLNVGWGIKALVDVRRHQSYQALVALATVLAVWLVSYLVVKLAV
ncbi:MAG TPA: hypothetical protein VNN22_01110 [Verrucomicrobiae bacterium]|nr:hypothetical protein [Verrucomicrobiae bacterium]